MMTTKTEYPEVISDCRGDYVSKEDYDVLLSKYQRLDERYLDLLEEHVELTFRMEGLEK